MVRLRQQEAQCIIDVQNRLDTKVSHLAQLCFCLSYYSGLRRGEIAGLQFADFSSRGDHWGMLLKANSKCLALRTCLKYFAPYTSH